MKVDDFIDETNRAATPEALANLFRAAIARAGYDNVIMAEVCGSDILGLPLLHCPEGYPEYYFDSRFHEIDPVLPLAMTTRGPYHWADIGRQMPLTREQQSFFDDCVGAGVADGLTVPIHGPRGATTVISLSSRDRNPDGRHFTAHVHLLSVQYSLARWRLLNPDASLERPVVLSPRERECLRWCKAGKSAWDISQILGISERTAQFHISNAMAKLGASSRIAAVVIAIQHGLLGL